MSRVCQVTGRRTRVGNSIARRGLAKPKGGIGLKTTGITRRKFKANVQNKRIWVPELKQWVRVRLSAKALKTISSKGAYRVLADAGLIKPIKPRKR
jgi:large subunit ribosomal protein L28